MLYHRKFYSHISNRKLPDLIIPSKTATLVPEFAVEGLPLDDSCNLGSYVCNERPALGQNSLIVISLVFFPF